MATPAQPAVKAKAGLPPVSKSVTTPAGGAYPLAKSKLRPVGKPATSPASFTFSPKRRGPEKFKWSSYGLADKSDTFGDDFQSTPEWWKTFGDGFQSTSEWWIGYLSRKLRVPVASCQVKEKDDGPGRSGCRYFWVTVTYNGPVTNSTLGFPTALFVKARRPNQADTEFAPECVVPALIARMENKPPMCQILWADADCVIMPDNSEHLPSTKAVDFSVEDLKKILELYAHMHATCWKLPLVEGLKGRSDWVATCTMQKTVDNNTKVFNEFLDTYDFPSKDVVKKTYGQIGGMTKVFDYINSHGTTLVQGDAHVGQLLKYKNSGEWALIDFGMATVASPAIDVGCLLGAWYGSQIEDDDGSTPHDPEELIRWYWTHLTQERLPKEEVLQMNFEQFRSDVNVAMAWRIIQFLVLVTLVFKPEEAKEHAEHLKVFIPKAKRALASHLKDATFTEELLAAVSSHAASSAR